ncbi:ArsR/SmtB family transcription factor [Alkalicoccus luteus]|uniref:Winged helix-turn-helix transcriptional regulator n=1 Tax=Alkalicoccus luteus TaxID=1237094 RepID=A0A969TVX8_9BACI|nr:metalloregulator ArsR/SmtB family transcription factor [Alkalicoccus luteus]NJP36804.1 winged helix-turn-helix transcriptional regulator [Alkalicoccus luteus]
MTTAAERMTVEPAADLFKLLGDKTRLHMVSMLAVDEICVCEFVELFQMSQPSISQHLKKLKQKEIVRERKHNQWVFYSLNPESPFYPMIMSIVKELPDPKPRLLQIEKDGLRVNCC